MINKKMKKENLIIAYGSKNISLNKGENHIVLNQEEIAFLLKSLLNNMKLKLNNKK